MSKAALQGIFKRTHQRDSNRPWSNMLRNNSEARRVEINLKFFVSSK